MLVLLFVFLIAFFGMVLSPVGDMITEFVGGRRKLAGVICMVPAGLLAYGAERLTMRLLEHRKMRREDRR